MSYIIWLIAGIVFIVLELIISGLISVWLGVSAFVVAILSFVTMRLDIQLIVFSVLSLVLIFTTRMFGIVKPTEDNSTIITDEVKIVKVLSDTEFEVIYKGSVWTAFSDQPLSVEVNSTARIVNFKGNKINITL